MIQPQVINLSTGNDVYLAIDGYNVIDSGMVELSGAPWNGAQINITVYLYSLTSGSTTSGNTVLDYDTDSDFWHLPISGISSLLTDRTKYVGRIIERSGTASGMLPVKIQEFSVDNDSFEAVTMRLPFEVVIGATSWIQWYAVGDIGGTVLFKAKAYQNGEGVVAATDPSRVTHRDAIIVGP